VTKRLTRDTRRAAIAGVAAGLARHLDVDPTLVRLAFILMTLVPGHSIGLLVYVVCWVVMPRDDAPAVEAGGLANADPLATLAATGDPRQGRAFFGIAVMSLGLALLFHNLGWLHWPDWLRLSTIWPLILVAIGANLVRGSLYRRAS
jgi:phage shock protein PspC (stress-responsive transcriptional regulator)